MSPRPPGTTRHTLYMPELLIVIRVPTAPTMYTTTSTCTTHAPPPTPPPLQITTRGWWVRRTRPGLRATTSLWHFAPKYSSHTLTCAKRKQDSKRAIHRHHSFVWPRRRFGEAVVWPLQIPASRAIAGVEGKDCAI